MNFTSLAEVLANLPLILIPTSPISFSSAHLSRRSRKLQSLHSTQKSPLPIGGLPVNCCGPAASPGGPLGSLATLSAYNTHKVKRNVIDVGYNNNGFYRMVKSTEL